jgi:integrase
MSRPRRTPSYRRHKQSGQAVVTLTDPSGARRDVYLGAYGTAASRQEYIRVLAEWEAAGRHLPPLTTAANLSLAELINRYWRHVEEYYRHPDGTPTGEVQAMRYALRPLNHLHGKTPARDFGPSALKAVRELMVRGYEHPKYGTQSPLCRTRINAQVKRIRRMFKWAVENDLVPASVHQALCAVAPLKRGRTQARESEPVKPVARAVVEETLPILRPMLADMVRLQLETGMRPGELVVMRGCDIDMTGTIWLYRPKAHKTQHHGHERIIPIGPKAQAIIRRHLKPSVEAYLFSPADAVAEFRALQRQARKSKVQPSQKDRRKQRPKRKPGEVYTVQAYGHAIAQAIKLANTARSCDPCKPLPPAERCAECQAKALRHWHPHQLRHQRALELKREAGLDVARAVLGHRSPNITEHYATLDIAKAASAMEKLG